MKKWKWFIIVSLLVVLLSAVSIFPVNAVSDGSCNIQLQPGDIGITNVSLGVRNSSDNHPADNLVGVIAAGTEVHVIDVACSNGWGMLRIERTSNMIRDPKVPDLGRYWIAENNGYDFWVTFVSHWVPTEAPIDE